MTIWSIFEINHKNNKNKNNKNNNNKNNNNKNNNYKPRNASVYDSRSKIDLKYEMYLRICKYFKSQDIS